MFFWYALGGVFLLIASCEYYAFKTGVPTVTSLPSIRKKMIALLKEEAASYKGEGVFSILDLGSGTGKLALEIGRALPQARVVGLEISWAPFLLSLLRCQIWRLFFGVKNVSYRRVNFWSYDASWADAVTVYMTAKVRARMAEKLKKELHPGVLVISNESHLPGWEPIEVSGVGLLNLKVVVYRAPGE